MIRVGISGWRYEGWRGNFYPEDLPQRRELEFAARHLAFLLAAAFILVAREYGNLNASLGFGAGFLVVAIVVLAGYKLAARAAARRRASPGHAA